MTPRLPRRRAGNDQPLAVANFPEGHTCVRASAEGRAARSTAARGTGSIPSPTPINGPALASTAGEGPPVSIEGSSTVIREQRSPQSQSPSSGRLPLAGTSTGGKANHPCTCSARQAGDSARSALPLASRTGTGGTPGREPKPPRINEERRDAHAWVRDPGKRTRPAIRPPHQLSRIA